MDVAPANKAGPITAPAKERVTATLSTRPARKAK